MKILPTSNASLAAAIAVLRAGGLVVHATETCYGLACDLSNPDAVRKLFAAKQRPETQPISGLFPSVENAKQYVEWNASADELASKYLPGPITLILPLRPDAPHHLFPIPAGSATIGVRVSSNAFAQELAAAFGSPISTTSANIHGQANPYSADDILAQFRDQAVQPDLVIDAGRLPSVPPSTVIDLSKGGGQTLRKGSVSA